jgi:hypothetical protein
MNNKKMTELAWLQVLKENSMNIIQPNDYDC